MTFSVIIPAYNCAGTLESTVRSIQLSGLYDYEIILVDDGSTDGTAALCDELSGKFAEIRCVHQQNAGVSAARNRGIAEARGEYLWFVDADDTVDEGSLADAAKVAEEQKPDMLIFGMSFDFYHKGKVYRRESLVPPYDGAILPEQLKSHFKEFYECNSFTPVWNKFCRKDIIVEHKIAFHKDMILMEDFLFVLELLAHCENIYCVPKAIYRYKQAENEKKIINRLRKIESISKFVYPFEIAMDALLHYGTDKAVPNFAIKEYIIESLYLMITRQRLYMANLKTVIMISNEIMESENNYYIKNILRSRDKMFLDLAKRKCCKVIVNNRIMIAKKEIRKRIQIVNGAFLEKHDQMCNKDNKKINVSKNIL